MVKKSITIKDVAREAGVSFITVSRVVNNSGYVSKEKRQKVLNAIKDTNYKPNLIARSLKLKRTKTIGFLFPDILNPYITRVTKKIEEFAYKKGYNVILCVTENNRQREIEYIETLKSKIVDGYIIFPANLEIKNKYSEIFKGENVVSVERKIDVEGETCVKLNNFYAMKLALNYLIKLGHKKISIVNIPMVSPTGYERFQGYKKVLEDNGIELDNNIIKFTNYRNRSKSSMEIIEDAREQAFDLMALKNKPTAIISAGIYASVGILQAFMKKEIKVPHDISFISFDELYEYSTLLNYSPTVIKQPAEKIGKMAVELLLEKIEGKNSLNKSVELKPELVIGDSCRKIIKK